MDYKMEAIEWTQVWRENAPDASVPRYLLVGDSISVGYRSVVEKALDGKAHITAVSTSKAVDNPYLAEEILFAARQELSPIAKVHVNNGLHGWHLSTEEYEAGLEKLLRALMAALPDAAFSVALSTPLSVAGDLSTLDPERIGTVLARNEAVVRVAQRLQLPVDDLYGTILLHSTLHLEDGCHYTEAGYEILGRQVADFLERG